ncbi:hypothetical protein EYF80_012370 [Liparis tanakae]|uniref:Uncharacterized protein n=1 Tax=Liparis tanakae TaxID=230148 RepID=A0A4Z2IHL3_9TELE|nr:hypothetical protein EYF80_012370 [Liparis tanakae]
MGLMGLSMLGLQHVTITWMICSLAQWQDVVKGSRMLPSEKAMHRRLRLNNTTLLCFFNLNRRDLRCNKDCMN